MQEKSSQRSTPIESIRITGDQPADRPRLGFEHYARGIAGAIRGGEPAQFTIGLYGPWGSGKSSLLRSVGRELAVPPSDCIVVEFDAWRYQPGGEMVSSLLQVISNELSTSQKLSNFANKLRAYALAVLRGAKVKIGIDFAVDFDASSLADAMDEPAEVPAIALPTIVAAMRDDAKALGDKRVVVLIDDLDRCSPANLVAVLETINNVMDIRGFVFVLALDYEVLVKAIRTEYPHVSGHEFIEKLVQVPFRVPPLDLEDNNLLRDLLPNWSSIVAQTQTGFDAVLLEVVRIALRGNPRQTKRLINSFLVLRNIVGSRGGNINDALLVTVLGMQFGWPEEYARLQRTILLERPNDVDALLSTFDQDETSDLSRLIRNRLSSNANLTGLTAAIHLASEISPSRDLNPDHAALEEFEYLLQGAGWVPAEGLENVWYPNETILQWQTVRFANHRGRLSLEMREFAGGGRKPAFQTITHVPIREARSLLETAELLTQDKGSVQRWRSKKIQERGGSR